MCVSARRIAKLRGRSPTCFQRMPTARGAVTLPRRLCERPCSAVNAPGELTFIASQRDVINTHSVVCLQGSSRSFCEAWTLLSIFLCAFISAPFHSCDNSGALAAAPDE